MGGRQRKTDPPPPPVVLGSTILGKFFLPRARAQFFGRRRSAKKRPEPPGHGEAIWRPGPTLPIAAIGFPLRALFDFKRQPPVQNFPIFWRENGAPELKRTRVLFRAPSPAASTGIFSHFSATKLGVGDFFKFGLGQKSARFLARKRPPGAQADTSAFSFFGRRSSRWDFFFLSFR